MLDVTEGLNWQQEKYIQVLKIIIIKHVLSLCMSQEGTREKAAPLFCSEEASAVLSGVKNREWNSRR